MEILFTLLYCIDKEYPRLRIPAGEVSTEWKNGYQYLVKIEYVGQRYDIKTDSETTDGVRKVRTSSLTTAPFGIRESCRADELVVGIR